jgi:sporulation protein YlmC with PRC-barrel domain
MNAGELRLSRILGRHIHDSEGDRIGRIMELRAEVVLREDGSDYEVVELLVGAHGWLEGLAGGRFAQGVIQRLRPLAGFRGYRIPWRVVDLEDPEHPRLTCRREDLSSYEQ